MASTSKFVSIILSTSLALTGAQFTTFEDLGLERIRIESCEGTEHFSFATVASGCDGNAKATLFHSNCQLPVRVTFDIGSNKVVEGMSIGATIYDDFPREWTLSGSKDDVSYTSIYSQDHDFAPIENRQNFGYVGYGTYGRSGPFRNYTFFDQSGSYRYYKLDVTLSTPGRVNRECIQWSEVDLYAKIDTTITTATTTTITTTSQTATTHTVYQDNDREIVSLNQRIIALEQLVTAQAHVLNEIDNVTIKQLSATSTASVLRLNTLESTTSAIKQAIANVVTLLPRTTIDNDDEGGGGGGGGGDECTTCRPTIQADGLNMVFDATGGNVMIKTAVCGEVDPCSTKNILATVALALTELRNA